MEESTRTALPGRIVAIAGATGLVGREILNGLLADDLVIAVHAFGRRALSISHPRIISHVVDFTDLPVFPQLDEVYLALGTTIKAAGGKAAFRAVDLDANLAVANAAISAGARRIGLVSAIGADANSRIFYNRIKGELENALAALPAEAVIIAQPSLLLGDREALGQPLRHGEKIGSIISRLLRPLIPMNYRPIEAHRAADALLATMKDAKGQIILSSEAMQKFGRKLPRHSNLTLI